MKYVLVILLLAASVAGCKREVGEETKPAGPQSRSSPATQPSRLPRVVFLGDSLTAGYGVDADQAFPALIADALKKERIPIDLVNAGVSGDTTAGGLRRLEWQLKQKPDVIVVGLGGNDGLRAQDVKASEENLRQIIAKSRAAGAEVLLLGMLIPPNYGPEYTAQFRAIYPRLAQEFDVPLVPFLLEGVGGDVRLNQGDGIHPTAAGHERVAANVLPHLRELVRRRTSTTAPAH
jgi:acyl-CoA thioesterase I